VTRLGAVDAEGGFDQVPVLDGRRRTGVGGHADVLELCGRREERHRVLHREAEVELRFLDGRAVEALDGRHERLDVFFLVLLYRPQFVVDPVGQVAVLAEGRTATETVLTDVVEALLVEPRLEVLEGQGVIEDGDVVLEFAAGFLALRVVVRTVLFVLVLSEGRPRQRAADREGAECPSRPGDELSPRVAVRVAS